MQAIVLAAGKGTRMGSDRPKVLHDLGGAPMLLRPLKMLLDLRADPVVVVVGHGHQQVREAVASALPGETAIAYALQPQQRGTGDAVRCALPELVPAAGPVLITAGDVPLLRRQDVEQLVRLVEEGADLAVATFVPPDPSGYGRIVRDAAGEVEKIVEQRDATPAQAALSECNSGVYCARPEFLREQIPNLRTDNAQGEFYLTDLVARAASVRRAATAQVDPTSVRGVNTRQQLEELERELAAGG